MASRFDAHFLANLKKDMQRLLELGAKFIEVLAVKVSTATEPKKFIAKQVDIFIVFDLCLLTVNRRYVHSSTPCCFNHLRILANAPLSVFGKG